MKIGFLILSQHHDQDGEPSFVIFDPQEVLAQPLLSCLILIVQITMIHPCGGPRMVGLDLPSNVHHQDVEFTADPFQRIIRHLVDHVADGFQGGTCFLVVKIMGIVEGFLFKKMTFFPVKGRITIGAKHLETARLFFNRHMATRALFCGFRD